MLGFKQLAEIYLEDIQVRVKASKFAIKKLKLKQFSLHDFRHSHASILFQSGVNIVKISKRLGHESIKMTLDTYSHLVDTDEDKMLEVLNELNNI